MKKLIITIALLLNTSIYAEGFGQVDGNSFAHVGMSAAINSVMYIGLSRMMRSEQELKLPLLIGTSSFTLLIGLAVETSDAIERGDRRIDPADMGANILGVAASATAIYFLDIHNVKPTPTGLQVGWNF